MSLKSDERGQLKEHPIWVYFLLTAVAWGVLTVINGGI